MGLVEQPFQVGPTLDEFFGPVGGLAPVQDSICVVDKQLGQFRAVHRLRPEFVERRYAGFAFFDLRDGSQQDVERVAIV